MDFASARRNMVECQLRPNRVTNESLLAAMGTLPRERFLPESLRSVAYVDKNLSVAPGRFILEPQILGRLIQAAEPSAGDVSLVVGAGTGYSAAVMASLVETVFAVESDPALAAMATALLSDLALDNVVVVEGVLTEGLSEQGPFNVILVNGAISDLPEKLTAQLAENGRLVAVLSGPQGVGHARLLHRSSSGLSSRTLFEASVPELPDFKKKAGFVF